MLWPVLAACPFSHSPNNICAPETGLGTGLFYDRGVKHLLWEDFLNRTSPPKSQVFG